MRNLKKFLALVLALMMVVSVMVTVNAASTSNAAQDAAVETLQNYGVLQGFEDGQAHPEKDITRAQMAALVYRIMTGDTTVNEDDVTEKYGAEATKRFTDAGGDWYTGYIGWCANNGVLKGYPDKTVKPNQQIKGYEVQAMLLRALGYDKNNEYSGDDWTYNILSDATESGVNKGVSFDPAAQTRRGIVAQLTVNAAVNAKRVAPAVVPNIGYNTLADSLIKVTSEKGTDDFGAPSTVYNLTFTWPTEDVKTSNEVPEEPLATYYGPVDECDVADDLGLTYAGKTVKTFTNGVGNEGKRDINPAHTNETLGAQGRETIVYADRIVYKDTVLATVTGVTPAKVDTAGHVITPASATVTVYGNNVFQLLDGANFKETPAARTGAGYKVEGTFTESQILTANILTYTGSNWINKISGAAAPDADYTLVNAKAATPTQVTVASIVYDNKIAKTIGFKGTDGVQYLYDVTYGYYDGDNSVKTLDSTDINKTFYVYTDGRNNVLGLVPVPAAGDSGVGVITAAEPVKVGSIKGVDKYGLELTLLKEDGSSKTITWIGNNAALAGAFNGGSAAYNGDLYDASTKHVERKLVRYSLNSSGFYNVTVGPSDADRNLILAGQPDALSNTVLLTNKTVIFVEKYKMDTTLDKTGKTYVTDGYDIYTGGFETIPDLSRGTSTVVVENGETLSAAANVMRYYYVDTNGDNYANYALVVWATQQATDKVETVPSYAYINTDRLQAEIYGDYYQFNALLNGVSGTLKVTGDSYKMVQANGTGLYIYTTKTNGTCEITGYVNKETGAWAHKDGALTLSSYQAVNDVKPEKKYLAVAPDAAIYLVNNTTGKVYTGYTLDNLKSVYGAADVDLYFQTNEYGFVDLIYAVEPDVDTPVTPTVKTANITYVVNIVDRNTGTVGETVTRAKTGTDGQKYYQSLTTVLQYVGLRPENLLPYGTLPENGTVVGGVDVTLTFNVYYM